MDFSFVISAGNPSNSFRGCATPLPEQRITAPDARRTSTRRHPSFNESFVGGKDGDMEFCDFCGGITSPYALRRSQLHRSPDAYLWIEADEFLDGTLPLGSAHVVPGSSQG